MPGDEFGKDARAGGGGDVLGADVVFQGDGDAVERAAITIAVAGAGSKKFGFGFFGLRESEFGSNGDIGVEFGVELDDAREQKTDELDRREFALAEEARDFFDGGEGEIGVGGWGHGHEREWEFNTTHRGGDNDLESLE